MKTNLRKKLTEALAENQRLREDLARERASFLELQCNAQKRIIELTDRLEAEQ